MEQNSVRDEYEWDVFVSHAREDKVPFVRDLVAALRSRGLRVWFDEDLLTIGDSLRRSIDAGLRRSRFGIVVLSPHFFAKEWTQKELDALTARDDGREKVILPIWHDVSFSDVLRFSPLLADKLALSRSDGVNTLAVAIAALVFAEMKKHNQSAGVAGTALSRIRNSRGIIAGCISQPPLLDFVVDGNHVSAVGLYAMLAEEVAILEGLTIEYVALRFSQMVDAIVSHQVDVVLCTFPTPDRLRRVDFAALLHRVGVGAVVRSKQGRVKSADDLKRPDIYVGVVKGEVGWEYSRAFLTLDGNSRFKVLDPECMSDLIELVRAGEVDVVLCDALSCRHWSDKKAARDELSVNPFIVWKPEVGVMVPTGEPDLKEWLTRCFRLARSSPSASSEESRILNEYPGIVERID